MSRGSPQRNLPRLHPRIAVALRYAAGQGEAPRVVASGKGLIAKHIEEIALEAGVPLHEDPELAELLGEVPVQDTIPEELFEAVAQVIAFVWRVDHRISKESG